MKCHRTNQQKSLNDTRLPFHNNFVDHSYFKKYGKQTDEMWVFPGENERLIFKTVGNDVVTVPNC